MPAYVNNLSACGLLCGHNFLLSMTCIMKLIFKNLHILCTLCNYEGEQCPILARRRRFEIGRKVTRILFMSKVLKGFATFPKLVEKIEIIVLSTKLRNFNILRIWSLRFIFHEHCNCFDHSLVDGTCSFLFFFRVFKLKRDSCSRIS